MREEVKARAKALLEEGLADRVLGWKAGDFVYDQTPAVFKTPEEVERSFVYSAFSSPNLSKYLIAESRKPGKIAAFLKPCDSYSFQQLVKEHRVLPERVHVVGVSCGGMCDVEALRSRGIRGLLSLEETGDTWTAETLTGNVVLEKQAVLLERCKTCKTKKLACYDEIIGPDGQPGDESRFDEVRKLDAMSPEERFEFWRGELSRCIRCNACRNVCPACSCETCVFDNPRSGVAGKAAADPFEENLFHIIRAFHVAGRCTDCGECSRVCPQHIPLHLLNRKLIQDINQLYGPYQAGADRQTPSPLTSFTAQDPEPGVIAQRGGADA